MSDSEDALPSQSKMDHSMKTSAAQTNVVLAGEGTRVEQSTPTANKADDQHATNCDLVIITGMSGAGRTEAMHTFEDMGFFCIDNLPPSLLRSLVKSDSIPGQEGLPRRLAVVCDARNRSFFHELTSELTLLRNDGVSYRIIFLDSSNDALIARYKASRRRHPLCTDARMTIAQGIREERSLLRELRTAADLVIDTTNLRPIALRQKITAAFGDATDHNKMSIVVYSFGFKHGSPLDADIVIDVRFLPNPYYDPALRPLTGLDEAVRDFIMQRSETEEFLKRWYALLDCVVPGYIKEGKQQLAIGVGCTGGQHRSVALACATGDFLTSRGYQVHVSHRDLARAEVAATGKERG